MRVLGLLVAAVALGLGMAAAGWFVGEGFIRARSGDRFVTVKGLAEREVKADLAVWPLRFVATGNDLAEVQAKVRDDAARVQKFLTDAGIAADEIGLQSLEVTDVLAQPYHQGPVESRFIIAQTLVVRTGNVDLVAKASQHVSDLVEAGVVLSNELNPAGGPNYLFTKLNDLKPEMIAEATRQARAGAEQFAADSHSRVGAIRRANQGVFQILPRDPVPGLVEQRQIDKRVRVVSTIDYYLVQ
jgi:hypothetical protein